MAEHELLDEDELLDDEDTEALELARGSNADDHGIPDVIKAFIGHFHRLLNDKNLYDLHNIYENAFPKLTDRFFKNSPWPSVAVVAPLVDNNEVFLMLYRELYFRHLYSIQNPTFQQRIDSWENYCSFFSFLLTQSTPVQIELPTQWLWDMIDEFVSQFQSFRLFYSASYKSFSAQELQVLKENSRVWRASDVMFYLNELISKANILQALAAEHRNAPHDEIRQIQGVFGSKSIYRMLGYFAIIGLSRVHCLLGDYFMTLKNLDPLEVNQKRLYTRSTSFQISLYYHLGFAFLMCRRYPDAIKAFSTILLSISRSRGAQQSRTGLGDQVAQATERINALLAIAITLCPQRLDESINTALWDSFGERIVRMQRGEIAVFGELFDLAAPPFVYGSNIDPSVTATAAAASADEDSEAASSSASSPADGKSRAFRTQQRLFLNEVSQQILIPTIRSYLKLYTTIDVAKLAHFLDIDVKQVIQHMISFKHKAQTKRWQTAGVPAQPQALTTGDLRFFFQQDMVHISSDKGPRRYSTYYIRQISKFDEILQDLKTKRDTVPALSLQAE